MRVEGVGELSDGGYWRLVYDGCGHTQEFAHEGVPDFDEAASYVRRNYPRCLSCSRGNRSLGASAMNTVPDEIHLKLSRTEIEILVAGLRQYETIPLLERLEHVLRQTAPE